MIFFEAKSNILFGDNGSGKTNILESISMISKGRGFRNANIVDLIKNNNEGFLIGSTLEIDNNNYNIEIQSKKIDDKYKKIVNLNDDSSKENQTFLNSKLSYLIFLPEMERLFQSSPSYRRNFIDRLIFSEHKDYNKLINKYKKNITERTKILQQYKIDESWINYVENQISEIGLKIYEIRNTQINILNKHIGILNKINTYDFSVNLILKDSFFYDNLTKESYLAQLIQNRDYDRKFGGIKIGPHKSDLVGKINNEFDASQLSTGQQKTVVLMILLAQCNYLINTVNVKPILLLDEICSHLDKNNRKILLDLINQFDIQLFLTGTEKTLFSFISTNVKFYNITEL